MEVLEHCVLTLEPLGVVAELVNERSRHQIVAYKSPTLGYVQMARFDWAVLYSSHKHGRIPPFPYDSHEEVASRLMYLHECGLVAPVLTEDHFKFPSSITAQLPTEKAQG